MNNLRTFLNWLLNLMLLLAVVALSVIVVTAWQERDNDRFVPGLGRYKLISVLSDSMQPVMRAGDAIVVDSKAAGQLGKGDIITYWRDNNAHSLMTHRITNLENRGGQSLYYTRGDANNVMDGNPVRIQDVLGKYLFTVPRGGYLTGFLHTRAGFMLLIMLPILAALLLEVKRMYPKLAPVLYKKCNQRAHQMPTED